MKTCRLVWLSLLVGLGLWTGLGWAQQPKYGGTLLFVAQLESVPQ